MLLIRGLVRTLDPARPVARALLCDEKVRALDEEALAAAPPSVEVLDVGEGVAVPGLCDAHAHLLALGEALSTVDLRGAGSPQEAARRAGEAARSLPPGAWLTGRGWDQESWPAKALPDHAPLSAAVPDRPAAFSRIDGHALWVNAAALAAAAIGPGTPDPPGGRILRGPGGAPTGVLLDAAMNLVLDRAPRPSPAQRRAWLHAAFARCLAVGLVQVHDAGADPETLAIYRALDAERALPLRVYAMVDAAAPGATEERARGPQGWDESGMLAVRAVKIYADGALGSRGALLFENYADAPGERGLAVTPAETVERWAREWSAAGFQVAIHAIGDRANAEALDLFARLGAERPRLEHAQILRREDIARAGALGAVASVQPVHAWSDLAWLSRRLVPAQLAGAYAWRSLAAAGARLALGSDFPVEEADPMLGLCAAVEREAWRPAPLGWRSDERLDVETALRGYTEGGAWASFAENRRGRLVPGMDADLTLLDADPLSGGDALHRARPWATVVAGRVRWRR